MTKFIFKSSFDKLIRDSDKLVKIAEGSRQTMISHNVKIIDEKFLNPPSSTPMSKTSEFINYSETGTKVKTRY